MKVGKHLEKGFLFFLLLNVRMCLGVLSWVGWFFVVIVFTSALFQEVGIAKIKLFD